MIRVGSPADADAIGHIFVRARDTMTYLPHIGDDVRQNLGGWITARHEIWVLEDRGRVIGFAGLSTGWLDHLYVVPDCQGRGFGSMLLSMSRDSNQREPNCGCFKRTLERDAFTSATIFDWKG